MSKFKSFLAHDMEAYATYRKAALNWNNTHEMNLFYFDRYCSQMHPNAKMLTQEIVHGWCTQRTTENNNSCITRIGVISSFVKYLKSRGKTNIAGPDMPKKERYTYIPHAFTSSELINFFNACDNLPSIPKITKVLSRKITVPVFFRLLYSSGIRTNEARLLKVEDVDLEHGVLNIRNSKGNTQHYVALHDSMLILLKRYDIVISKIYPNRQYLFPSPKGFYRENWVARNFRECWFKHNSSYARAYDLRHNYAIENINQWVGEGFNFDYKLLYLSKSMGHSTIESTKYYYSLVPAMADVIERLEQDFNDMVPEVPYE